MVPSPQGRSHDGARHAPSERLVPVKVGVFLHGTAIMHAAAAAVGRGERIRCVVLPEFSGLAGLPDDPAELLTRGGTATSLPGNRRATAEAPT